MKLIIRKGEEKDFPALLKLIQEEALLGGSLDAVKNSLIQMKDEEENIHFFLAEQNGEAVGMAVYYFAYYTWVGKSIHLDDLYVKQEYRGTGIGTKLLYKIFEVAKNESSNRLRWEVEEDNVAAQKFYTTLGTTISDKWFNCSFDKGGIDTFLLRNHKFK